MADVARYRARTTKIEERQRKNRERAETRGRPDRRRQWGVIVPGEFGDDGDEMAEEESAGYSAGSEHEESHGEGSSEESEVGTSEDERQREEEERAVRYESDSGGCSLYMDDAAEEDEEKQKKKRVKKRVLESDSENEGLEKKGPLQRALKSGTTVRRAARAEKSRAKDDGGKRRAVQTSITAFLGGSGSFGGDRKI